MGAVLQGSARRDVASGSNKNQRWRPGGERADKPAGKPWVGKKAGTVPTEQGACYISGRGTWGIEGPLG